jgi:hypothetical protein
MGRNGKIMKTNIWFKNKTTACNCLVASLVCSGALAGCSRAATDDKLAADEIAAKSRAAYAALSSYRDEGTVVSEMSGRKTTLTFKTHLQRPNLYRIEWKQGDASEGVVWADDTGDHILSSGLGQQKAGQPQKLPSMKLALATAAGPSWSAACAVAGTFFNQEAGDIFVGPALAGTFPLHREKNEKLGEIECYVLSAEMDFSKQPQPEKPGKAYTTLWIGTGDALIHQSRTRYVEKVDASASNDQAVDEAIRKALEAQNKPVTPEAIAAMRPQMRAIMKQVQATLKSGFEAGIVFTRLHEHIVVNKHASPSEFAR